MSEIVKRKSIDDIFQIKISLLEQIETFDYIGYEATCGKKEGYVFISKRSGGSITVLCINAAHKVYRGLGRSFNTIEEALGAYKSPEMKSIINYAKVYGALN